MSLGKLLSERKKDKKIEGRNEMNDKEGHWFKKQSSDTGSRAKFRHRILQEAISE